MSKIEDALEKANKLRQVDKVEIKSRPDLSNGVEPIEVDNPYIVTMSEPDSPVAEEYRRLKSMVIRKTKKDFLNTLMITSAVDGEGKSITAINLAVSLAQEIDHSILLVDSDLRNPMIHKYLGIENKYGLSDYLTGDVDISDILIRTGIGNLVVIPAGKAVQNPMELLSSDKMESLIKELKQRYVDRYVIIDTPPILSFAEAISIGAYVDGVVFVIKERGPQKKDVENALTMIKDLRILGFILNGSNTISTSGYNNQPSYNKYKSKE